MHKSLSASDIFRIANKCCNVYTYPEFKELVKSGKSAKDAFRYNPDLILSHEVVGSGMPFDNRSIVILYLTQPNYGHWCGLNRLPKSYNFMDSYGTVPDDQLDYIDKNFRESSDQLHRWLSKLLARDNKQFRYNDKKLQVMDGKIATCGRYIALFIENNNMTVEQFVDELAKLAIDFGCNFDELVTKLTPLG